MKKVWLVGSLVAWAMIATWCGGSKTTEAVDNTNATVAQVVDTNTTTPTPTPTPEPTPTPVNHAPVLENSEEIVISAKEGTKIVLDLSAYKDRFSDPDGDELVYKVETDNNDLYEVSADWNITFSAPQVEATTSYTGTITAIDPQGLESAPLIATFNSIDRADDAPLIFTELTLEETVVNPVGALVGTTDINDSDWIESVVFSIDWTELTNTWDINNFACDIMWLGLDDWEYTLTVSAIGKIKYDSENYNSWERVKTIAFTVETPDTQAPVITLNGSSTVTLTQYETYVELWATAIDNEDWDVDVVITWTVNTDKVWTYIVTYTSTDSAWNKSVKKRTVIVEEVPNKVPTANAWPDKTITEWDSVTFYGNWTDSDGTISSYIWRNSATWEVVWTSKNLTRNWLSVWTHTYSLQTKDNDWAYSKKDYVKVTVNEAPISTPVIDELWTITINDQDSFVDVYVWTVSWTDIQTWATFSSINDKTVWQLKIDSTTWEMIRRWDEAGNDSYSITIEVKNPDGWKDTMIFTLNVNDKITL